MDSHFSSHNIVRRKRYFLFSPLEIRLSSLMNYDFCVFRHIHLAHFCVHCLAVEFDLSELQRCAVSHCWNFLLMLSGFVEKGNLIDNKK